jgi:hypothetical protein
MPSEDEMVQWFKALMRINEGMTPVEKTLLLANAMRDACGGVWVIKADADRFTIECSRDTLSGYARADTRTRT